ncbi:DUF4245 domain-containing protein [Modestobacter lapidis]|nr:DUF4245 domain-containing protein [Modestobacter lapidis]
MPDPGPRGQRPDEQLTQVPPAAVPPPATSRAAAFTPANMVRSLLPLTVLILVIVGVTTLRQNPADPVREVDPGPSISLAAERAGYPLLVPQGLPDGWRPTSVRTDAVDGAAGDPVTLEIGWLTPAEQYAGFVISDRRDADPLDDVLADATDAGTTQIGGVTWDRRTTERGETALTRTEGPVTLLITGSAPDEELAALAAAVAPYRAP